MHAKLRSKLHVHASAAQMQLYNGVAEHCGEELIQGPYVAASAEFEPAILFGRKAPNLPLSHHVPQ